MILVVSSVVLLYQRDLRGRQHDSPDQPLEPLLHEYVAPPSSADAAEPDPPSDPAARKSGEQVYSDGTDRDKSVSPDRDTIHRGELNYNASFDPTVAPFKRFSALDKVGSDFKLYVADPSLKRVDRIPWSPSSSRQVFWGSFLVSPVPERPIPIPSVAPDMIPHRINTKPAGIKVSFYKDGADNYYLTLNRSEALQAARRHNKKVRVLAFFSAPVNYFGGSLPRPPWRAELVASAPRLPPRVARSAMQVLAYMGIKAQDPMDRTLNRLTYYFRDFHQGKLDLNTGLSYLDLALSGKGVCRHRAYAFVITAQASGFPARYVTNEAHAFVEVYIPRNGWRRIDLGGATPRMNLHNAVSKRSHRPPPDPFPKPPAYRSNRSDGSKGGGSDGSSGTSRIKGASDLKGGSSPGDLVDARSVGLVSSSRNHNGEPIDSLPPPVQSPLPARLPLQVGQVALVSNGIRGKPFVVSGTVTDRSGPLDKIRVVVLAYRSGQTTAAVLGEALTEPHGRFTLSGVIPADMQVGTYNIFAFAPAQKKHDSALSD